jgi:flagellar hook-associated protein 2
MATTSNIANSLGAGSGIDIKSLAQSLVDAEKTPQKERIDAKIKQSEARITGYGAMKYALSELKTAFEKLNDASDFSSIKPSNTQPTALSITSSSTAESGSYSINVLNTAQAQRTASTAFPLRSTTLNNGSAFTLSLSIGSGDDITTTPISVTTPTPAGMVSAINGAKLGVTAQLINSGNGHQLVLTGQTGADQSFSISSTATSATATTASAEGSALEVTADASSTAVSVTYQDEDDNTINLPLTKGTDGVWRPTDENFLTPANMTVDVTWPTPVMPVFSQSLQSAADASFQVNGLLVSRSSNTVTDVIDGVTLDLFTSTTGAARIDLNRDTSSIKDNIKGLVTAYNDFETSLKILGDRKSEVEEFGGSLAGETLLQSVRSQVRAMITDTSSTPGTNITAARNVGLSIDRNGKLTLDEAKLETALQDNFNEVSTLFSAGTNNQSIYSTAAGGIAGDAINKIEKMLRSTGEIDSKTKANSTKIEAYKKDLDVLEKRMEKLLERYMRQFSMMESIVGSSTSTREGLKGTFEGMMNAYK